ncbi:class I SAM-dependent methyltransferase [Haloplanus halobius]|uniref:class I SAM-dependent methyltransferase n=1 Tax=Haloplanus halobius TaxID=2934938 RepID=UPI00200D33B9|nr:class I SAM-dependent methyltransferase [Haloplanus sp. XH21]
MDRPDPRATYDRIAEHFAATREYPWPEIESFVDDADPVALGLDIGCGNARHAEVLAERADRVVGLDASRGLLQAARERQDARGFDADLVQGDAARLPVAPSRFGLAVYVATLHHLRPREIRLASLDELSRVLAPGGRALVSVWSTTHDRFDATEGFDTTVDWTLPGGETVPRYYHVYDPDEFERDLTASALAVHDSFLASGNCYAVVGPEVD